MYSNIGRMAIYPKIIQNEMSFSKTKYDTMIIKMSRYLGTKGLVFFILEKVMFAMFTVILTWLSICYFNTHVRDAPSRAPGVVGLLSTPGQ